jgi:hypothetical protein
MISKKEEEGQRGRTCTAAAAMRGCLEREPLARFYFRERLSELVPWELQFRGNTEVLRSAFIDR